MCPGRVPFLAAAVEHAAVLLEELVGDLEHGDEQAALWRPGRMPAAGRPPDEFAGADFNAGVGAFLVDQRAFQHVSLLDQNMFMVGQLGARRHFDQHGGEPAFGIEQQRLHLAAGKAHLLPRHVLGAHHARAQRIDRLCIVGIRLDVHGLPPGSVNSECIAYSTGLILASCTILPNLAVSESTKLLYSAGVMVLGTMPCGINLSAIEGSLSALLMMPLSRSTIAGGVPAVMNRPNQFSNS